MRHRLADSQDWGAPMPQNRFSPSRRHFLETTGGLSLALAGGLLVPTGRALGGDAAKQQPDGATDHTIRIAPVSLEIGAGRTIKTTGYNDVVPGSVLRLKEGRPVAINVVNDSGYPNLIHWHGLHVPSEPDGAVEEGSVLIAPDNSHLYKFTPQPAGTRWYHSHAMAMKDLDKSTYSGEFGFLIVEPAAGDPGRTIARFCSRRAIGTGIGSACRT